MNVLWLCLLQLVVRVATRAQSCTNGDIRMTKSSVRLENDTYYLAGGLQVCVDSKWATVCQSGWDDIDATVACRQLGFYYGGELCQDSCFGNIRTNPAFHGYQCNGNEVQLANCGKSRNTGCGDAAGVHCIEMVLGLIAGLLGMALVGVVMCLILTCIKLHRVKPTSQKSTSWSMDNTVYGMTEMSHTDSSQQHTLPVHTEGNYKTTGPPPPHHHSQGDYDLVAPQHTPLEDAVYSQLEPDNMEPSPNHHTHYTQPLPPQQTEDHQECAVYALLENEQHKTYSTIN